MHLSLFWDFSAAHCNTVQHTSAHCNTLQHAQCFPKWTSDCFQGFDQGAFRKALLFPKSFSFFQKWPRQRLWIECSNSWRLGILKSFLQPVTPSTKTNFALQHTATHCNTLQHTATHCNTLQHTATHRNTLQHTATHCNTLQHTATHCNTLCNTLQHTKSRRTSARALHRYEFCNLQFSWKNIHTIYNTHCDTLQQAATGCNTLQHTATPKNPHKSTNFHSFPYIHSYVPPGMGKFRKAK